MVKLPSLVSAVLIGAAVLALKCGYDGKRRAEGAAAVRDSIAAHRIDSLTKVRNRVDTVYHRDTVTQWRTVRATETLIDTLLRSDTVTLTRRESVIVFAADSAIQACRSIVSLCERRVTIRDSLITSITADRNVWRARAQPSLAKQAKSTITTIGVWEAIRAIVRAIQ